MKEIQFKIPASSANLGLGFDSMGLAVDLFLDIQAILSDKWTFTFANPSLEVLEQDESNLVAVTAKDVAKHFQKEMPALKVVMDSEIPLAHGLGSSSSAIVAGIELANYYCDLNLNEYDKILMASQIEGHPDNVGPCITGGAFVGYYGDGQLHYHSFDLPNVGLIVSVPDYEILTADARKAIPDAYPKQVAVSQNAINNVLVLSLYKGDYQQAGQLMMQDQFHEPYRQPLIKEFQEVKATALESGAYATVISGAGPTMLTLCDLGQVDQVLSSLEKITACKHRAVNVFNY